MRMRSATLTLPAALLTAACSSLSVLPGTETKGGVPFYLPQHEFVITQLGLTDQGQPATIVPLRINLVRRADPGRMFLINHSPAWLSASEFSFERDEDGLITSVFGKTDEKAIETATAVAALAARIGAMVATGADRQAELQATLATLKAIHKRLLEELDTAAGQKPMDVAVVMKLQENLTETRARIAAIEKELKAIADAKTTVGTVATETLPAAVVKPVASAAEAKSHAAGLKPGEIGIFLRPVN